MAKKETLNPITAFRKANEARKAVVMKSLKKAQAGIAQDTSVHELSHAAQEPIKKYIPWKGKVNLKKLEEESEFLKPTREYANPRMNPNYNPNPPAPIKKKNGGPVKRKNKTC